jgi:hypothetical protein
MMNKIIGVFLLMQVLATKLIHSEVITMAVSKSGKSNGSIKHDQPFPAADIYIFEDSEEVLMSITTGSYNVNICRVAMKGLQI